MLYTFNPYARMAPEFWNIVQDNISSVSWTLLEHRIEESSEISFLNGTYNNLLKDTCAKFASKDYFKVIMDEKWMKSIHV